MVPEEMPEEAAAGGKDSVLDMSEKDLGEQSAAMSVAVLETRISEQAQEVMCVTYWPMILVDKSGT